MFRYLYLFCRNVGLLCVDNPPFADFEARSKSLNAAGKPCEVLDAARLRARYPSFRFGSEVKAFVDPNGGILRADRCLRALQVLQVLHLQVVECEVIGR